MNKLFIFSTFILLCSCSNYSNNEVEDEDSINDCIAVLKSAESFKAVDVALPCGLKFGMNMHDFKNHLDSLSRDTDNGIKKEGSQYIYMYKANNNVYECNIIPHSSSYNPLDTIAPINRYSFVFNNSIVFFRGDVKKLFEDIKNENKELNFAECQLDYIRSYERKGRWIEKKHTANIYCWSFESLGIILTDYQVLSMNFYNAANAYPSSKFLDIVRSIKATKEEEKAKTINRQKKKKFGIHT